MKSTNIILSAFMLMTIALASCKAETVQQSQEKDLWSSYLQYRDSTDADMLGMLEQMNSNIEFGKYQGSNPLTPNIITEMPELEHPEMASWVRLYNDWITCHNIFSEISIFERAIFSANDEDDLQNLSFANLGTDIAAYPSEGLFDKEVTQAIKEVQSTATTFFSDFDHGKQPDDAILYMTINNLWDTIDSLYVMTWKRPDDEMYEAAVEAWTAWREQPDSTFWEGLGEDEEEAIRLFSAAYEQAKTFDEKYALAMGAVRKLPDFIPLTAMRRLLESGEYSPCLPYLWLGWRSLLQVTYYGRSRDSDLADDLFNEYRKMAFLTILKYADQHPEDEQAKFQLFFIASYNNIVRNGSCLFGHDGNLEEMSIFPLPFDNE